MDLIDAFVRIRSILETIPIKSQNPTHHQIYQQITEYIETNCNHHVIQDQIDFSPEYSKTIYYCEHCMKSYDYKEYLALTNLR